MNGFRSNPPSWLVIAFKIYNNVFTTDAISYCTLDKPRLSIKSFL
jgi:hypothetical protein